MVNNCIYRKVFKYLLKGRKTELSPFNKVKNFICFNKEFKYVL